MILFELILSFATALWQSLKPILFTLLSAFAAICTLVFICANVFLLHIPYKIEKHYQPAKSYTSNLNKRIKIRHLGVTGYEITDGTTTLILDPALTRPEFFTAASQPIASDLALLKKFQLEKADFVLANHSHYDHAIDVAAVAKLSGAKVIGSTNTLNMARAIGIGEDRLILAQDKKKIIANTFTITVSKSKHAPIAGIAKPMGGLLRPIDKKRRFWQYRLDETYIFHLQSGSDTIWFHPTVLYHPGELLGLKADTLIFGATGAKITQENISQALKLVEPKLILPTHYDNFFQPMSKGMSLLPVTQLASLAKFCQAERPEADFIVLDYNQTIFN